MNCVWNWYENSLLQSVQVYHKSFACKYYKWLHFCLHNYPRTAYCVAYSCQCQYLLKSTIYNYCNVWPNQQRPHGPIFSGLKRGSWISGKSWKGLFFMWLRDALEVLNAISPRSPRSGDTRVQVKSEMVSRLCRIGRLVMLYTSS